MKYARWMILSAMLVVVSFARVPQGDAGYGSSENDASVRQLGMAWNMADDRKMENIAGVNEPEGLDKYMQRYFVQFSSKLDALSAKIDQLSQQVAKMSEQLAKKDASRESSQGKLL